MKRIILAFILFSLCIASAAQAGASILSPKAGADFNLGQELIVTGHLTLNETVKSAQVDFKIESDYLGESIKITTKYYTFTKDIPISFAQINQEILSWVIPDTIRPADDWRVVIDISKEDEEITEMISSKFSITNELTLTASVNSKRFNMGETLELSGTVLDARSSPIEGTATISLEEKKVGIVLTDTIAVSRGYLSYSYDFKSTDPKGDYTLSLIVKDENGNNGTFKEDDISVSDELHLSCSLGTTTYDAGSIVLVYGDLKNIHDESMGNELLTLWVSSPSGNQSIQHTKDTDLYGDYEFKITLPKYAVPGEYEARISVKDADGNSGACTQTFDVVAEEKLDVFLDVNSSWSYPRETVTLTTRLNNKGNVDLSGDLNFILGSTEVLTTPFTVKRGETEIVTVGWNVTGDIGNNTLQVKVLKGTTLLAKSQSLTFEIVRPPEQTSKTWLIATGAIILLAAATILYAYRKDMRDAIWHREFKKKAPEESISP